MLRPGEPVTVPLEPPGPVTVVSQPPEALQLAVAAPGEVTVGVTPAAPVSLTVGPERAVLAVSQPETITVEVAGRIGPPGPAGSGESGGGWYRHAQAAPADVWLIDHPLGYRPAVTTEDSAGTVIAGDVSYVDDYTVVVRFAVAIGGYANLS